VSNHNYAICDWDNAQGTKTENTNDGNLLSKNQFHSQDLKQWQRKDDKVHKTMRQVSAKVVLSNIIETFSLDGLIPVRLNGHAMKDSHECSYRNPNSTAHHEDDDGYANGRELKEAPVECEDGHFAEENGP
jgi:hypothetical protein